MTKRASVRISVKGDVDFLKNKLREADKEEIMASHGHTAEEALKISLNDSVICYTIERGKPIGMFGINPYDLSGTSAVIWLLTSEDIKEIRMSFLKQCRKYIDGFLEVYPLLFNYVYEKNKMSIKWIKWLGGKVYEPIPYGMNGEKFHYFEFRRINNV
jgi:hypothetical protein